MLFENYHTLQFGILGLLHGYDFPCRELLMHLKVFLLWIIIFAIEI